MKEKKFLILERSGENLNFTKDDDGSIYLQGIFTEIGVRNKNNRIYSEEEVLPHIAELQEKIKHKALLGELDHPKDFDVSLKNVSHIIESLEYDKEKKQVIGKIRLLNTAKGRDAQALVKDGIPLHISSRAAGTVDENGRVKIKKMFTYDLVADPGFANAELKRVNESFGFENDDDLFIYDVTETSTYKENEKNNNIDNMSNAEYVKSEDFQKYTEYVNGVLESVKKISEESQKNNTNDDPKFEKLIKYTESIAEKVNKMEEYSNYLAERLDKSINYSNYLAETANSIKEYADYLGEELNNSNINTDSVKEHLANIENYTNYLAENIENNIKYSEYLGENLDNSIKYSEYLSENLDNSIKFSNYIAENVDNSIKYSEYLKESIDKSISYSEYIGEQLENSIAYSEYVAENVDDSIAYSEYIKESVENLQNEGLKYTPVTESQNNDNSTLDDKINHLISIAESNANGGFSFMNLLSEQKRNEFKTLGAEKQAKVIESMNKTVVTNTLQAEAIYESALKPTQEPKTFDDLVPEKYKERWNALSDARKIQICNESKFYPMNTPYQINNFWATRDLRDQIVNPAYLQQQLNENNNNNDNNVNEQYQLSDDFKNSLIERVRSNMQR